MKSQTSKRKKDHIELCLTDDVKFNYRTNGFENYEFEHFAPTEVRIEKIDLSTNFFKKKISYPFLISCMTGGTGEAAKINEKLAIAARHLNIPIGVGSQRQSLENSNHLNSFKVIRKNAGNVPVIGNLGAAQVAKSKNIVENVQYLSDLIEADAFVIHLNPLQELIQPEGQTDFKGLIKAVERLAAKLKIPLIAKEVGSGISVAASRILLEAGVKGIDVAGAGGTSWAAVELIRSKKEDQYFREWGLPTSYCLRTVNQLRKKYRFMLISSGGINMPEEIAKSLLLGADIAASARKILQVVNSYGESGVIDLVNEWFNVVKKIMYLTGSPDIKSFKKKNLIRKSELY
ncbi:MAG TPA: type 2 isopentenyl-diphosphate Delta-isomerase [Melioribacteraceae bacterium]|nr:type 2 isopentenyl-diphosphate Delta-isomerase [Melioribacteraceae bacterium]